MAAGREPLDLTRDEVQRLTDALKDEEFRKLLADYCKETQSPEAREAYQREFTELERQRGFIITFITPHPGYVIKTSVSGDRKAFVNVCYSNLVAEPTYKRTDSAGTDWSLPYSLSPSREDYDKSKQKCNVYDVVFHYNTLHIASKNSSFKTMLTQTALEAVEKNHSVTLDKNNIKYPKTEFKGPVVPAIIRKPDPDYKETPEVDTELLDKLYPQKNYNIEELQSKVDDIHLELNSLDYTVPKYTIKHRREIDIKEFTYERDAKQLSAIPSHLILNVYLPLLSSSADTVLNIKNKQFSLTSLKPSYKLDITLPYNVDDNAGTAKFDLSKRTLVITLPVIPDKVIWYREDSGVESDLNSPCGSDEDNGKMPSLITELSDAPGIEVISESETYRTNTFFDPSHTVPAHSCNVIDNVLIITLDVKNVNPDSIKHEQSDDEIMLKFNSVGSGFFTMNYGLTLKIPEGSKCCQVIPEVWDNNVVLQVEISSDCMDHYWMGLSDDMIKYDLKIPIRNNHTNIVKLNEPVDFLEKDVCYLLPLYSFNVMDNMMAFTFQIRDVKSETFAFKRIPENDAFQIKFSSLDSDKTINHYSLYLKFPCHIEYDNPAFDVLNDNAILRLVVSKSLPDLILIGSNEHDLTEEYLDALAEKISEVQSTAGPHSNVEVTAKGRNETSILLSRNEENKMKVIPRKKVESLDGGICSSSGSFKGILKYRNNRMERSLSESNVDLMEYNESPSYSLSSADCIPEESSSLKKTVRFSDVIAKQTFRSNSSILGQKSKNQRKKRNKKRAQDRRVSEGDPDDGLSENVDDNEDVFLNGKCGFDDKKLNRRDSGVVDTDEGDSDDKPGVDLKFSHFSKESNQGKYLEVNFKNDMIFDLDM